jgi:predicted lactoylglutathione lyase
MIMNYIMLYLYANDIQLSLDFYHAIGFTIASDDYDGHDLRHVRIAHRECGNMLIALEKYPDLLTASAKRINRDDHPLRVALTIVSDDYFSWVERMEAGSIKPALEIIEPYGVWMYYHDPAGNLLCISNTSLW